MKIDTENLVSMTDANQNFSQVVKRLKTMEKLLYLRITSHNT